MTSGVNITDLEKIGILDRRTGILALFCHALRRESHASSWFEDFRHERRGIAHLKLSGEVGKTRYIMITADTAEDSPTFKVSY